MADNVFFVGDVEVRINHDRGAAHAIEVAEAVECALSDGSVVTVHHEPLEPLAMGNYKTVVEVWKKRERPGE